ncbi:SpaA isopeptide-forming pilin-related protein [Bacillus bingmayongensis]|uniref:SpaA isopeptide-forming pilin-related protein n=1 Tax=Bacillus bingmayongensis TaxID=1150157 RepID=UPI001C8D920E|nr:SpaA isopeptide-forming pilin-related protein [Bacillus bingmayongensis]MBY0596945.1 Cys-Gln thioester bond-forming surface protein [Bacillus bingmayongensis]
MLKRSYQMLLIVTSMLLIVLNFVFPLTKASAEVINREKYEMNWSYSPMYGKDLRTELLKNANGQIAYCLTYGKLSPNGDDLPEMGRTDNIVYRVLVNGYPQKSPEELGVSDWKQAHYATQLSVWASLGQIDINEVEHRDASIAKAVKTIIDGANASQETQEMYMNVTPADNQEAKLNGEYFETTVYQVESNARNGVFTVHLKNAPNGTKIVSENGEAKEQFHLGEQFRILIPKSSQTGDFSLQVTSNLSKLHAVAYKGNDKVQDATVLLERNEEKVSTDLRVHWKSLGGLKVVKVGERKEVLAGAVFEVFNSANQKVGTITTNEQGTASLSGLEIGTYTLKEVKAPTGYVRNDNPQTLEVKTGEIATITVENARIKGNIEIKKLSDSGKVLPGVEFTVYQGGKEITKVVTNEKGIAQVKDLSHGDYYFMETKGAEGHLLNKTKYPFQIKEQGKTLTFIVENKEVKGNVQLLKVDAENPEKKLEGATFILQDSKGKKISEHKTDRSGKIQIKDLPFGSYQFVEKQAPGGYVLSKDPIPFNISENGKTIELTVKNKQITGSLVITKVDLADGNNKLPGAEFTIYDEQGKEVVKGKTNEEGIATFEKLSAGKYTYKETIAPDGYLINEETFSFEIKKDGQIIKHTVKDEKKPTPETPHQPEQPQKPEKPEIPQPEQPEQPKVTEKPVTPQSEKPHKIITQPQQEQTPKKVETKLPETGGKAENPYWKWIGFACIALGFTGAVFALRHRKKAE